MEVDKVPNQDRDACSIDAMDGSVANGMEPSSIQSLGNTGNVLRLSSEGCLQQEAAGHEDGALKVPAGCGKDTTCANGKDAVCDQMVIPQERDPTMASTSARHKTDIVVRHIGANAVSIRAPVSVGGRTLKAVIDSGAEVSVLNCEEYKRLPARCHSQIRAPALDLVVADGGRRLGAHGVIDLEFFINDLPFTWPVYVAPIADGLLLGCDILDAHDWTLSSRRGLLVGDTWVDCEVTRRPVDLRRVVLKVDAPLILPPQHEVMMSLPFPDFSLTSERFAVTEPLVEDRRDFLMARCLVDTWRETVPIRMINLSDEPVKLDRGYPLGELQPVAEEAEIVPVSDANGDAPDRDFISGSCEGEAADGSCQDMEQVEAEVIGEATQLPEHLQDLYITTAKRIVNPDARQQLRSLLQDRQSAFARNKADLGCFKGASHEINTAFAAPVRERVRPTPKGFEGEEKKCLDEQLESGVVRPSSSAWASATVLVRKTDGSVRYCVDYRKVNDRTVKDSYPLPRINMCFDSLGGSRWFTTLDLQSGYWQIPVAESDIPKTAFITKYGLYEYTKMPFGLCNAPSTFQRCMEMVFRGLQWHTLLIYLDDIIVLGATMQENLARLDQVLGRLVEAGLKLKPSKCQILQEEVLFLGHIVSATGLRPNPRLVDAVCGWREPTNRREVQQFLGLSNYYRRFVPDFSTIAAPLTRLTSKEVPFVWNLDAEQSFDRLKEELSTAPILAFPKEVGEFILDTDASGIGVGAVLQQMQDNEERVIAYASKKLSKQQQRYCVTRRELLAIVVFLREWRHYLLGREFVIRTDHGSLAWLLNFKEPQGQLARWMEYIYQFNFHITHRAGSKHGNADALSRQPSGPDSCISSYKVSLEALPCGGCRYCTQRHQEWSDFNEHVDDVVPLSHTCRQVVTRSQAKEAEKPRDLKEATETEVTAPGQPKPGPEIPRSTADTFLAGASWVEGLTSEDLRKAQLEDPELQVLHQWLEMRQKPPREKAASLSSSLRTHWLNFELVKVVEGVAFQQWVDPCQPSVITLKLLVPARLRKDILQLCHDSTLAGHLGIRKTLSRIRRRFHWPGLKRDVKVHIEACPTCALSKLPAKRYRAAMADFRVGAPMDRLGIDILGPLPQTTQGNRCLLVIVDYFTRWVEVFPLPDQTAKTIAHSLVHEFVCRFGAPLEIHTDQGRNFESSLFREVCRLLDIYKTRTTPYHPSSNGLVERFNRTLAALIRSYLDRHTSDWDIHIPLLTCAYRSTVHPSTGFTPNYLMLGREITMPVDLAFPQVTRSIGSVPEYVEQLQEKLSSCYSLARENLKSAAERQRKTHDTRITQKHYKNGQAVLKRNHQGHKLSKPWVGPYIIHKSLSDCLYLVADKRKTYVLHHDSLKPYVAVPLPKWAQKLQKTISENEKSRP